MLSFQSFYARRRVPVFGRYFSEVSLFLLPELTRSQAIALGVALFLLGGSFAWKGYNALVKGRMLIWKGFLPFTIVSPFVTHLPPTKTRCCNIRRACGFM